MLADKTRPLRDLGGVGGAVKAGIVTNSNVLDGGALLLTKRTHDRVLASQ